MKRKIQLSEEERKYRNKFVLNLFKNTALTLESIGRIVGVSKQMVSIIIRNDKN